MVSVLVQAQNRDSDDHRNGVVQTDYTDRQKSSRGTFWSHTPRIRATMGMGGKHQEREVAFC